MNKKFYDFTNEDDWHLAQMETELLVIVLDELDNLDNYDGDWVMTELTPGFSMWMPVGENE